jgi:hypothetical protein
VSFIEALGKIVEGVPKHLGAGFFYWGAEYRGKGRAGGGFGAASFFDFNGNVLPVIDAVAGMGGQTSKIRSVSLPPKWRR